MKILVLAGLTKSLVVFRGELIQGMVAAGHEVVACAPEADDRGAVAQLGARFVQLPFSRRNVNPFSDIILMCAYRKLIKSERPDLVLSYTIKPNVYGMLAAHGCGVKRAVPMITGVGNAFIDKGSFKGKIIKGVSTFLYKRALKKCDRVIFQNPDDAKDFQKMGIVREAQIQLVNGSGVNMEKFTVSPLPEKPVFLMVARLTREKGVMEYVRAVQILKKEHPDARCLLLGPYEQKDGAYTPEDMAPFFGKDKVEYLGETDDVRPYIAQASALVLPSYREGTPRSLLEAMACGRAVITTDVPGCREVAKDGENGLLVAVKDVQALADAMGKLAVNQPLSETMGQAGQAYCRERYDVTKVNTTMMRLLGL